MPGLPLVARETTNSCCNCDNPLTVDHMCRQNSRVQLSAEETIAAEESLSIYCKPVELYNILKRRAQQNPSFLQRCLHYKIQAKHSRRIRMTFSLPGPINGVQAQNILPLHILLARPVSDTAVAGHSAVYNLARVSIVTAPSAFEKKDQSEVNFVLPEINKLSAEAKAGKLTILLVSCGEKRRSLCEGNAFKERMDSTSFSRDVGGYCLWGEIQMESVFLSWLECVSLRRDTSEALATIDMHSCFLETTCLEVGNCISFQIPDNPGTKQLHVNISAQVIGAKERSAYDSVPTSLLPEISRLRRGNVIFIYKYYHNKLQKSEVTEDFSCAFCLVQCASFKGLRYHLLAFHDLFNFEFWETNEQQAVNVFIKTDIWRPEIVAEELDPRGVTFCLCSKARKRRRSKNISQNSAHVHPHVLEPDSAEVPRESILGELKEKDAATHSFAMPTTASPMDSVNDGQPSKGREKTLKDFLKENDLQKGPENTYVSVSECIEHVISSPTITSQSSECNQSVFGSNLSPPAMLQFAKTRKLSAERTDPRNRMLLQKRQFFHSHRAQPMAMEQVFSERDSEDEVDDDIADFEDRRMLDDFVDVSKDEKQIMHLWNSFVRKQRVLADGHIPWACEAFSKLHGCDLGRAPALLRCWRLFMIKLWNHCLLDAQTIDNCNKILEKIQNESSEDNRQS